MRATNAAARLEHSIGAIYDSAVDPSAWARLPGVLAQLVDAQSCAVFVENAGTIGSLTAWNLEQAAPDYVAHYHRHDPWSERARCAPGLNSVLGEHIIAPGRYAETEYYRDFARFHGMFHAIGSHSPLACGLHFQIAGHRPRDAAPFGATEQALLDHVLPHVQRALQLRRRLELAEARAEIGFAGLSALSFPAVVCNAAGLVRFANPAAEALEREGSGLSLGTPARAVSVHRPVETRALRSLVHDAATGGSGGALRITEPRGGMLLGIVCPLAPSLRDRPGTGQLALVAFSSGRERPAFGGAVLSAGFGLTAAEAGLALDLLTSASVEEIAAERGVAISTVRTQLRSIFAKTGTESQRDVVRLLGSIPQLG